MLVVVAAVVFVIKLKSGKYVETVVVTFDTDGGSSIEFQIIPKGETASEPEAPVKDGFSFDKWMLGQEAFDFGKALNESVTLKATWISIEPEPDKEDDKEDGKEQNEESSQSSSESGQEGMSQDDPPAEEDHTDYGVVVSASDILSGSGPIYGLLSNHPGILGTLKAAVQKGLAEGEIVGISVTYPDGTVINTGFVIYSTDITSLGSVYLPDARRVFIKGFCEGMYVGIWIKHPDGTEFSNGFAVSGGDLGYLEAIAAQY